MWDDDIVVPQWEDGAGLLPEDRAWLRRVLGLSDPPIDDLRDWSEPIDMLDATPGMRTDQAAVSWDHGENALAEQALMSDDDLAAVERPCAVHADPEYPLPVALRRITDGHVTALAAIAYFEGRLHPLAQDRRRPKNRRPAHLAPEDQTRARR